MPSWDFVRGPTGVRLCLEVAATRGLPARECLRGTGLTVHEVTDPSTEVSAGQELQATRNLAEALGSPPGLGVEIGRRVSIGKLGTWAFAALSSANGAEALALMLRFTALSPTFLRIQARPSAEQTTFVLHDDELPPDLADLLLERDLAAIATILPTICGQTPLASFHTRLPPDSAGRLADLLGVQVDGPPARGGNHVVFDNAFLAAPLPQSHSATRLLCERECIRILRIRAAQPAIAARVRTRLFQQADLMPSLADIAGDLHLTERTLRRRLATEGTSYRRLRDEVRRSLAVNLLHTPGHSVTEVATQLGYSDPASFTHAFTRWEGVVPSKFAQS